VDRDRRRFRHLNDSRHASSPSVNLVLEYLNKVLLQQLFNFFRY
jgi:hypothetical protein